MRASTWDKAFSPENLPMVSAEIAPVIEAPEMGVGTFSSSPHAIKKIRVMALAQVVLITRSV